MSRRRPMIAVTSSRARSRRATLVGLLLLSLIAIPAGDATATPLLDDGFETGDLSAWSSSAAFTAQNQVLITGSFSGRATSTGVGAWVYEQLGTAQSDVYLKSAFNVLSTNGTTTLLRFRSSGGGSLLSLNVNQAGTLSLKNNVTGATRTSTTTVTMNTVHEAQLHGLVNGASSQVEVWLDGTPVADLSGADNLGTTPIGRVQLGQNGSSTPAYDVVYDDAVADTAFIVGGPPSVPTNLHTTSVSSSQVSLAWNAPSGATSYTVYRDGSPIGTPTAAAFHDTTVLPSTQYLYSVEACNGSGCSAQTPPLEVNTPPEGVDPPLFEDGFETGDLSAWSSSAAFAVQNQVLISGSFSGRATSTGTAGAWVYEQLGTAQSDVYFKSAFDVLSKAGTMTLLRFRSSAGASLLSLNVNQAGKLVVKNHVSGGSRSSATIVTMNAVHEVQLHGLVNGASSQVGVWLDGTPVGDLSGADNLGTTPIGQLQLGQNSSAPAYDVVYDDVVADTAFIVGGTPSVPTNLHTTSVTSNRVSLAWDASGGAASYNVYRDGSPIGTPTAAVFQDTTVLPSTQYLYSVEACNGAGCSSQTAQLEVNTPPEGADPIVLMAVGDVACDPADPNFNSGIGTSSKCRQQATAALLGPADAVLVVGDTQYDCGGAAAYGQSYDPSWGQFRSITHPIPGDEEYDTGGTNCGAAGADGYFGYFGAAAHRESDGYYSFDIGGWHVIALNSECNEIDPGTAADGCVEGSPQNDWLEADLAGTTESCTLAFLHTPLFASKNSGPQTHPEMQVFWDDLYAGGADIILGGNQHFYERFEPQDPLGVADPNGLVEFIVGTGGKSHGGLQPDPALRLPTSETGVSNEFGVLKLTLNPTSYDWEFVVEGPTTFADSGTASCH